MAIKRFCDRCGAEIHPSSSMTYISAKSAGYSYAIDYKLCGPCAYELKLWLNGKRNEPDE